MRNITNLPTPGRTLTLYRPASDLLEFTLQAKEKEYSGWLVVEAEQDPKKANPLEYAIKGHKYLVETLANSKIEIEKK